jgi:uncharacterized protein YceH (UPF0502 family)
MQFEKTTISKLHLLLVRSGQSEHEATERQKRAASIADADDVIIVRLNRHAGQASSVVPARRAGGRVPVRIVRAGVRGSAKALA